MFQKYEQVCQYSFCQKNRGWIWFVWILALTCLLPAPVLGQEEGAETAVSTPTIQRLNIQVMPEFDDPRVLVIVQGRLAENISLPQTLSFRVPRDAQINQMAIINMADGQPSPRTFDLANDPIDARWSVATYTIDNAHFFFEYYFDPLTANPEKQFTFAVSPLQPVADLVVEVQQPRTAEGFSTTPTSGGQRIDAYGLTFYQFQLGAMAAGAETAVSVQYTKSDPTPSVPRFNESSSAHAITDNATIPSWVIGLLALGVVGSISGFTWFRTRQRKPDAAYIPTPNYCPQCGVRQRTESRYCHACGAAL